MEHQHSGYFYKFIQLYVAIQLCFFHFSLIYKTKIKINGIVTHQDVSTPLSGWSNENIRLLG